MSGHEKTSAVYHESESLSGEAQEKVNDLLAEISLVVDQGNRKIAEFAAEDTEAMLDYAEGLIAEINERWNFAGTYFMVSGRWLKPVIGLNTEGIYATHVREEVLTVAPSNGFTLLRDEGSVAVTEPDEDGEGQTMVLQPASESEDPEYPAGQVPRIGMSFIVGRNVAHKTSAIQGQFQMLAFADLKMISVQYLRPGDDRFISPSKHVVEDRIQRADSLLNLYTNHPNSNFYRQSAKKQSEFFRSIIDFVADSLPTEQSQDRIILDEAITDTVLMQANQGRNVIAHVSADDEPAYSVTGRVMGITIPDRLWDGLDKQYAAPEEMDASELGICLIVQPTDTTVPMDEYDGGHLFVPLRAIKNDTLPLVEY